MADAAPVCSTRASPWPRTSRVPPKRAASPPRGGLFYRHRFAAEHGFVRHHIAAAQEGGIRGHPVALGQHQHIARHHGAARHGLGFAVAQHLGLRAGELAQGLHGVFGFAFLVERERHHHHHQPEQNAALLPVAQQSVEHGSPQQ